MQTPELNYKKIFLVIGFIFAAIFFGWLIFIMFFKPVINQGNINESDFYTGSEIPDNINSNERINEGGGLKGTNNTNISNTNQVQQGEAAEKKLPAVTKLTENGIKGIAMNLSGNQAIYYNKKDGKFYQINENGNTTLLSEKTFYDVQDVIWSPDKNKAIMEYPDGSNIVYDFNADEQTTLPLDWENFSFSSNNNQIVTKDYDSYSRNNQLIIADLNTGNAKVIENLGDKSNNFQINISPDSQIVAFYTESIDFNHQEIYPIGQFQENFKSFVVDGLGFQGYWNPDGSKILYSVYNSDNNYEPTLWVTDRTGSFKKRIMINTWAEKCSFYNNNTVYCGVPQKLESMMGLSPNFAIDINDDIYRIDINKNFTEKIFSLEDGYNVKKLMITTDEKNLFFTDRRTGRLYKIDL